MSMREREKAQRRREARREQPPRAHLRHLRMSARKVRVVANLVKGKPVSEALSISLRSGRAALRGGYDVDKLVVKSIVVDDAGHLRRWRPRAMGRAYPIRKHRSHVTVVLDEAGK